MKGWLFTIFGLTFPFWVYGTTFWSQFRVLLALLFFGSLIVFFWKVAKAFSPGGSGGGNAGTTLGGFGAGEGGCDGGGGDGGC